MGSQIVVVVPAWDEAPRIGRVLCGIPAWVDAIVVVDDASRDGTAEAARATGDPRVEVLRHPTNRGVGASIVSGYRRATTLVAGARDVFVVMAGDGQMDPRDLPAVVAPVVRGQADYVKGTRFGTRRHRRDMPAARFIGGLALSWATSKAIGVSVTDSQCGYTAISREACTRIDLEALWPRYGYPNDLLSQLALGRMRIVEVPVLAVYADEVSRLKPRHLPSIAKLVARAWWRRVTSLPAPAAESPARAREHDRGRRAGRSSPA